jgi:hypothetical protein
MPKRFHYVVQLLTTGVHLMPLYNPSAASNPNGVIRPAYIAGEWYLGGGDLITAGASNSSLGGNSIRLYPGYLYGAAAITALGARISTVSSGGNLALGIFANNPALNRPTGLPLASAINLSTTTAALVSGAASYSWTSAQLVWFASWLDNSVAACAGLSSAPSMGALFGTATQANLQPSSTMLYSLSFAATYSATSGVFPDLTGQTFVENSSNAIPSVQIKF